MTRRHAGSWGRVRCPRADLHSAFGQLRASVPRHYDRGGECPLGWDRRRRVTPVQTASQEAWPGAEPWGRRLPLARTVVGRRQACASPLDARPCSAARQVKGLRLSAFRFLYLLLWRRRVKRTESRETTALLWFINPRFALPPSRSALRRTGHVAGICKTRAHARRENGILFAGPTRCRGARHRALAPCGRGLRRRCIMRCRVRGCGPNPSPNCVLCEAERPSPARGEGGRGCAVGIAGTHPPHRRGAR
jgi:hypothetical protein